MFHSVLPYQLEQHRIISDVLGYNKVCVRWVPRMLTDEIKRIQMQTSNHDIKLYKADLPNFFVDMWPWTRPTWTHHFKP